HFHADHPVFSCSKIEQVQWNTWVSFQSAQWAKLGQFSVSGNTITPSGRLNPIAFRYWVGPLSPRRKVRLPIVRLSTGRRMIRFFPQLRNRSAWPLLTKAI
ncbi:hypothetical protein, partial [Pseudomonas monteilii]|uniref:hypothetical protein n=1 Tax=Pseudomonas monteilii TaxID=76759 RepID=UPI001C715A13